MTARLRLLCARIAGRIQMLTLARRVRFGTRVRFVGRARIELAKGARVVLGDNVVLNSCPAGYHGHMAAPTALIADRPESLIRIGDNTRVNGAAIHAWREVSIGRNCLIASGVQIFDANGHATSMAAPAQRLHTPDVPRPVIVEDDVWLGVNVVVLPGSRIGTGAIVSANSVVSGDIPVHTVASGVPAVVRPASPTSPSAPPPAPGRTQRAMPCPSPRQPTGRRVSCSRPTTGAA